MSTDLAKLVRESCVGIFMRDTTRGRSFGENEVNKDYNWLCNPTDNYSRWNPSYWFLPKLFREVVGAPNNPHPQKIGLFHYSVNRSRLEHNAKKRADLKKSLNLPHIELAVFLEWFDDQYQKPSCLYSHTVGEFLVIGDNDVTQEVMGALKSEPQRVVEFIKGLSLGWSLLEKKPSSIYLCDAVTKPQEILYSL